MHLSVSDQLVYSTEIPPWTSVMDRLSYLLDWMNLFRTDRMEDKANIPYPAERPSEGREGQWSEGFDKRNEGATGQTFLPCLWPRMHGAFFLPSFKGALSGRRPRCSRGPLQLRIPVKPSWVRSLDIYFFYLLLIGNAEVKHTETRKTDVTEKKKLVVNSLTIWILTI